jgi:non-heme chloroperoxidase
MWRRNQTLVQVSDVGLHPSTHSALRLDGPHGRLRTPIRLVKTSRPSFRPHTPPTDLVGSHKVVKVPAITLRSGLELSYSEQGSPDGRAAVLIPGPTDSWRSYGPVLPLIPDHLHVVAVSLRGHGDSSKPPTGYRIEDLASDVGPLLDALAIERAVLAGHSGSCLIARRVALEAPDRVAGLFLEASPTTLRGDDDLRQFVDTVVSELSFPIGRDFARSFVADTSSEDLDPEFVKHLVDDLIKVPVLAWRQMFASLLEYDDTTELARMEVPVSLIWGDADALVPRQMQQQLMRLLPQAALSVYEGVGHTPRWEEPERFAQDLTTFASQVLR